MPADQVFQELRGRIAQLAPFGLVLASEIHIGEPELRRVNIHEDVGADFGRVAAQVVERAEDIELREYDPGYKPEPHEWVYLDLAASEAVRAKVTTIGNLQAAALFQGEDDIVDHLRFYAAAFGGQRKAIFFRSYSPRKELTRSGGFAIMLSAGTYRKVTRSTFVFDEDFDCVAYRGFVFVKHIAAFQRIFRYFEAIRDQANEVVSAVIERVPIENDNQFRAACVGNVQMAERLTRLVRKEYFDRITMGDIRRTIEQFNLDVQIVEDGGEEKLVFDGSPARRWLIVKLLDDSFLGSVMTEEKYEVNSKTRLA
jgi:hypothetical protein